MGLAKPVHVDRPALARLSGLRLPRALAVARRVEIEPHRIGLLFLSHVHPKVGVEGVEGVEVVDRRRSRLLTREHAVVTRRHAWNRRMAPKVAYRTRRSSACSAVLG